ncbi:MAG: TnpV protein [Ruminococcus sp.]|nr:TnpV protein [Ruminococcus sp.]
MPKHSIVKINGNYRIAEMNEQTKQYQILPETGRFSQMRLKFLTEEHPEILKDLLNSGTLYDHLTAVEEMSQELLLKTEQSMTAQDMEYLTAEKSGNFMKIVGLRNNYRLTAEEIIRKEIIFS